MPSIFGTIVLSMESWSSWYIIMHIWVLRMVEVNSLQIIVAKFISYKLCRNHQQSGPVLDEIGKR